MIVYNVDDTKEEIDKEFTDLFEFIKNLKHSDDDTSSIFGLWRDKTSNIEFFVKQVEKESIFKREISIYTKINGYKSIPKFHKAYHVNNKFYIVLEYIQGKRFTECSDVEKIWKFLETIVDILLYMQNSYILHCDLKPDNILETLDGEFKLVDFGLSIHEYTDHIMGTPLYMAPEYMNQSIYFFPEIHFNNFKKIDIWSLGVVLYEITHDEHPYNNSFLTIKELRDLSLDYNLKVKKSNLKPKLLTSNLPEEEHIRRVNVLNTIIDRCLIMNPNERISLSELKESIKLK